MAGREVYQRRVRARAFPRLELDAPDVGDELLLDNLESFIEDPSVEGSPPGKFPPFGHHPHLLCTPGGPDHITLPAAHKEAPARLIARIVWQKSASPPACLHRDDRARFRCYYPCGTCPAAGIFRQRGAHGGEAQRHTRL